MLFLKNIPKSCKFFLTFPVLSDVTYQTKKIFNQWIRPYFVFGWVIIWCSGIVQASQICPNITYGIWNGSRQATYSGCKINGSSTFGLRIESGSIKEFMDPLQYVYPSVVLVINTGSSQSFKVVDKGLDYTGDCTEILLGGGTGSVPAVVNHIYCHILEGTLGVTVTRTTWNGNSFNNSLATFLGSVPNTAPIITQGSSTDIGSTSEDISKSFTLNATDTEDNISSWSIITNPSHGSISGASGGGTSKTMSYIPTANWNGSDSFVIKVDDADGLFDTITVAINVNSVNDLPTFTSSAITSINEDSSYSYSITTNDVDGDSLTITATTKPAWLNFTDNGNGTATLTGTPTNDEVGIHNVTLNVNDTILNVDQIFTITVNNTNDSPILDFSENPILIAIDEDDFTNNGTSIDLIIDSVALNMITDVDSNPLEGIAVITIDNTNGSWEFSINTGSTWTAFGTVDEITSRLLASEVTNLIRFVPSPNFNGTTNISFRAWDQTNGSNGDTINISNNGGTTAFSSETETASLIINPVNDPPIFTSTEVITVDEDSPYSYSITTDDIDGDSLIITAPTKPDWLNLIDNGDGTATLSNTPTNDEVGLHEIILQVNDGNVDVEQTFSITVINTNDAPTFISTEITTINEDALYSYEIVTDDVDVGDVLTITTIDKPSWLNFVDNSDGTAILTSTPTNDEVGSFNVTLQVSDATVDIDQSFTITVNNTNDAPVLDFNEKLSLMTIEEDNLTNNGISVITIIDSMSLDIIVDVDGEPIEGLAIIDVDNSNGNWEFTTGSSWTVFGSVTKSTARLLAANNSNRIRFIPNPDFNGDTDIAFLAWDQTDGNNGETADVSDNGGSTAFSANAETASITINPTNDLPVFTSIAETVATENSEYFYEVTINDIEDDNLTITAPIIPAWLSLTNNGNGKATLAGIPTENDAGINSIQLLVNDGTADVTQNFVINISTLYQLSVHKIGNGTITSDGINCGDDCEQKFAIEQITEAVLIATPNIGWIFSAWSGDCDPNGIVTLDNSKSCTATFQQQYSLIINITGQGSVDDCAINCTKTYLNGEVISLTAIPAIDWQLVNWTGDCNANGVVTIDNAKTCTVVFEPVPLPDIPVIEPDDTTREENVVGEVVNEGILEDITVEPDAVISGGTIAGDVINEGTLESVTIDRRAVIEGGIIAGDVVNEGVLMNTTIEEGAVIVGGDILGISSNEGTLQDTTIEGSIAGGNYSGDTVNEGLISNATVNEGATLTGGKITGASINNGTMIDITITQYAKVEGGDFAGEIVNDGTMTDVTLLPGGTITGGVLDGEINSEGTIQDVILAEGTEILGGTIAGDITGDPDDPALLGDVTIAPGTTLSYVILSPTTVLPDDVKLGVGVILPDYDDPTPEDFGLASEDIQDLQADDIADLEPEVFATIDADLLAEIPDAAFAAIGAEQLAQFTEEALAAISPEQFENIPMDALAGLDAETMDNLSPTVLDKLTSEHISNLNVEEFQKMPSEDISKLLVNLNLDNLKPEDVTKLIPEGWDFNSETGKLTAPFGAKIATKTLSTSDNMPTIPDMNSGIGLGGSGTSLIESTTESLANEDLTDFVLSQEDSGILNVEGIGAEEGKKYTFIPDAENVIQVDTDKVPIGLSIGAGGFFTITTPEGLQYKVIPAPKDPVALSEAIGGEITVGKGGDVMMQLSKKVRDARSFQVVMFDPFVEPAPDSWCVFDNVTGESMCDFDNAPADMQPGIHFSRQRAKFKLLQAKVVYPDGSSQNITPAVYSPETFLAEGLNFPGVEKISLNMNGTFYVVHEGREYIVAPNFDIQTKTTISPVQIKLNGQGGVNYSVPIKSPKQTRQAREVDMMLIFDLFIEPAPESWCIDSDGAVFCDFDNMPEF